MEKSKIYILHNYQLVKRYGWPRHLLWDTALGTILHCYIHNAGLCVSHKTFSHIAALGSVEQIKIKIHKRKKQERKERRREGRKKGK